MSNQNLPVSKFTGQPSALTAMVRRSVGLDRPQQPPPQPQQRSQAQPRQKSLSHADLAQAVKAAVAEALAPLNDYLDQVNFELGGYPPPAQPVTKAGYSPSQAANRNLGYAYGVCVTRSAPFMDAETAQRIQRQRAAYAQQMEMKAYLADVAAGNDSGKAGIMAGHNQIRESQGPIVPGWSRMSVTDVGT